MDYNYLAESLAALAGVPVRIYRGGRFLSLHHTRFKPDFAITEEENIFNRYPGVKFGSMESANNEAGNWED